MRDGSEEEYVDYVAARIPVLRRLAYLLTSDSHRADDLVQQTITTLYVKWRRAQAADNIDAYVRTMLVRTFLDENRLDLIINVLTGDNDYDESSDSKLIRSLAIEQGIPLVTDVDVAIESIDQLVKRDVEGYYR